MSRTAGDPSPAYREGQLLPYVPPWVFRLDLTLKHALTRVANHELGGRIGAGLNVLSSRPLPHDQWASPFALLDMSAGIRFREFDLGVDVYNVLDRRWADTELSFPSSWPLGREIPSSLPSRHFVAGNPRTILANLTVSL